MPKLRYSLALVAMAVSFLLCTISYSRGGPEIKNIQGRVVVVDWVQSLLIVKVEDIFNGRNDEVTVFVPAGARIYRGSSAIGLADILQGDTVKVEYYDASPGPLKAVSIIDMNLADAMN